MYSDKKRNLKPLILLIILIVVIAAGAVVHAYRVSRENLAEEGLVAVRNTVERAALQCYAVEGVYPPDLQYLVDNYGLQINTRDYYVVYNAFSENLPPDIRVTERREGNEKR
ncbi:MAG: hypothetical protein IJH77_05900 [Mogibacterium sp.]|nr:hypothetical protein [Mogibacterium sp.]